MRPKTIVKFQVEVAQKLQSFTLFSAIESKFVPGDNLKHRQTELQTKSFEFQLVSKLFRDTFLGGAAGGGGGAGGLFGLGGGRAPVIHSILKLENKSI